MRVGIPSLCGPSTQLPIVVPIDLGSGSVARATTPLDPSCTGTTRVFVDEIRDTP